MTAICEYKPGLENIPAAQSSVSYVDGQKGILEYRGINIEELAEKSTFLETTYLLIWGELPTKQELAAFEHDIRYHRRIKYRIRDMMKCFPETGHPMDALQASAAALGLFYSRPEAQKAIDQGYQFYSASSGRAELREAIQDPTSGMLSWWKPSAA